MPVQMRITPSLEQASNLSATRLGSSQYSFSSIAIVGTDSDQNGVMLSGTISGGLANAPCCLGNMNTSGVLALTAEL